MSNLPNCPKCNLNTLMKMDPFWFVQCVVMSGLVDQIRKIMRNKELIKDANGNVLNDGDSVTVIKDLKVKGSSSTLKQGTKVKSIRLVEGDHNIDCKIDGFGAMKLKSEFVKKL